MQTHSQLATETLRRSAEHTMHALVRTVFSRLHFLDAEKEEARLRPGDENIPDSEIKMTVQTTVGVEEETQEIPSVHGFGSENGPDQEPLTSPRADRPQCMLNQSSVVDETQTSIIQMVYLQLLSFFVSLSTSWIQTTSNTPIRPALPL
jgi:hypothetical protein